MWREIPCSIYRGGTSKAIFVLDEDLPADKAMRNRVLLSIVGCEDGQRLNGIGGMTIPTSKIVIIKKSNRQDADIEYTHGQVSLSQPFIDYEPNGGNISFAVGPFAIHKGLVPAVEPFSTVKIFNTNTNKTMISRFQNEEHISTEKKSTLLKPDSMIELEFLNPAGTKTGKLFPTGSHLNLLQINHQTIPVSIIDAGNLTIIVHAKELGLVGTEVTQKEIDEKLGTIEEIRRAVCDMLTLYDDSVIVSEQVLPKVAIVSESQTYRTSIGTEVNQQEITLCARDLTAGSLHPSYPVTGAVALGIAVLIPGTIPSECVRNRKGGGDNEYCVIKIGHPSGVFEIEASVSRYESGWQAESIRLSSTAKPILEGKVYIQSSMFK